MIKNLYHELGVKEQLDPLEARYRCSIRDYKYKSLIRE